MTETILSRALRRLFACGSAAGLALCAPPLLAQTSPPGLQPPPTPTAAPMQRVEITGSSIRRVASETSLPITTIRASDFAKQGLATAQEVLNAIPMNQSSEGSTAAVGSGTGGRATADLRGLGGNKTLVLLNGRRLANHPYFADSVDLNIIPVAALERVEVLRDGASAIYGTDAIGGVINFITKRSVEGAALSVEAYEPYAQGGGNEQRLNLSGGWGDLERDGLSMWGVIDWHQQSPLRATDRSFSNTGIRPDRGMFEVSGTTFPANFFSDLGVTGNPYAPGCQPPDSVALPGEPLCAFDYTRFVDNIPRTRQFSAMARLNKKFGEHTAGLEFVHGRSTNEAQVAPPPLSGIGVIMTGDSPFYPGNGIVPAFPGLTGEPLDISWRPLETGPRNNFDSSITDRLLASLEGTVAGWDYNTAISYSLGKAKSIFNGGYVIDQRIIDGVAAGILTPFGPQNAQGADYLRNSILSGKYLHARIHSAAVDARASRELMTLPGGPLGFAIGAEFRRDRAKYFVNRELASQASSSGSADAQDQSGARSIWALFSEVNVPIVKDLELNVAARYDHYSDVGGSFNPKVSLRWQPTRQLLLRGSFNKGFRAPTLFDLYGPQTTTNSSDTYDDPVLCPNGVPAPGANPNIACGQQQLVRGGGNPDLSPERSRTYSAGIVVEPLQNLTLSLDYWNIRLKDQINSLAEQTIFGNYEKYRDLFVYDPDRHQPAVRAGHHRQPRRSEDPRPRPVGGLPHAAHALRQLQRQPGWHLRQQVRLPERAGRTVHRECRALCRRHPGLPLAPQPAVHPGPRRLELQPGQPLHVALHRPEHGGGAGVLQQGRALLDLVALGDLHRQQEGRADGGHQEPVRRRAALHQPGHQLPAGLRSALYGPARIHGVCARDLPLLTEGGRKKSRPALPAGRLSLERSARQAVPPTVTPSMRRVGWPTPTGTLWPSLPHTPTPESRRMSLPIIEILFIVSGPLPIRVAPFTG